MTGTRDPLNAFLDLPRSACSQCANPGLWRACGWRVKDIFDVAGYVTGCGNPRQARRGGACPETPLPPCRRCSMPARDSPARPQTDELGLLADGQNAHFPQPVNPAAPDRVTGGSSSGSAAAVAGGLADIAIGSDTGGSIRAPASFCGLIGLRTTHGRIPLDGAMPLAPSLDTFGWFADDIETYEAVGACPAWRATGTAALHPAAHASPRARRAGARARRGSREPMSDSVRVQSATGDRRQPTARVAVPAVAMDELYWCLRRLQAYEAWQAHGDMDLRAKPRDSAPASRSVSSSAQPIDEEDRAAETRAPHRLPHRAARAARRGRLPGPADRAGRGAAEERDAPRRCRPIANAP